VDESVLTKPDSRPDTDSRSVDTRARSVRSAASRSQYLPYLVVLTGVAGGVGWIWLGSRQVNAGMLTVAVALLLAAVARLVLPERRAGLLVSRRRVMDVLMFAFLGAATLAAVLVLPKGA
jgi:hypothetical protein